MPNKYKDQLKEVLQEKQALETPEPTPKSSNNLPPSKQRITIIGTVILCILVAIVTQLSSNPEPTKLYGKIMSPIAGTTTGTEIKVSAETKDLEPGQYVWLAVDKPEIDLCWPKMSAPANTRFMTTIKEAGPTGNYTVSLYAVPKTINDQWQEWLDQGRFGGLPILPEDRRLDSVDLLLGGNEGNWIKH